MAFLVGCADRPTFMPGDECQLNTECEVPLICRLGHCRTECRAQRDCPAGLDCVRDELGLGACQLEKETECTLASDCPDHLVCRFQRCVNACVTDRDCAPGATCAEDEDGERGCRDFSTMECLYNSECPEEQICANDHLCRPECKADRDCRDGNVCTGEVCRPPTDGGVTPDGGTPDGGVTPDGGTPDGGMADAGGGDAGVVMTAAPSLLGTGDSTTCAVAGDLRCWGENDSGQVGDGSMTNRHLPFVHSLTSVTRVAVGIDHACAAAGSSLSCWGDNSGNQIIAGSVTPYLAPEAVAGLPAGEEITGLACGRLHTCAIVNPNRLFCWGDNAVGQLGDGSGLNRDTPTEISLAGPALDVSIFNDTTCVVLSTGAVQCFGDNSAGQLGDGSTELSSLSPVTVSGISDAIDADTGTLTTCVLRRGGQVLCWGNNFFGGWGDGTAPSGAVRRMPVLASPVMLPAPARSISVGSTHACAQLSDSVYCWGENGGEQCGSDSLVFSVIATPLAVAGLGAIEELAAGRTHTCARVSGTNHVCFGNDNRGQLGFGDMIDNTGFTPTAVTWL